MKAIEAINKSLPIFLQYRSLEDEDLLDIFIKQGFEPSIARKIIVFMPIAFGRSLISNLGVDTSDEFKVGDIVEGRVQIKQRRKLKDIEIYREALLLSSAASEEEIDDETFRAVAGRSAELGAIGQLQAKGSNPRDIVLTSILTMWKIEEEPTYGGADQVGEGNTKSTPNKNWWEFWK